MNSSRDSKRVFHLFFNDSQSYHDIKPNFSKTYPTRNHTVSIDYDHYPKFTDGRSRKSNGIYQTKSQSSLHTNDSSSSGIDSIDEDSLDAHSSNSKSLTIRSHNSSMLSSTSPSFRKVILKPRDDKVAILNKQRRPRHRRRNQYRRQRHEQPIKEILHEKQLMYKNQSLLYISQRDPPRSIAKECESQEEQLKRLYDEYTNENIIRAEWQPLSFSDSRQLYQFVLDKNSKNLTTN
ncbi:hypothetical protein I4U23_024822 [Adineta vaga]|nr:hypothetical protein I4U23_024822 [Adineta vaga]